MRVENLPSPGLLGNAISLRNEAARAISRIEVNAGRMGGTTSGANQLYAFFTAAAAAVASLRDQVVPTVSTRVAAASSVVLTITFSEGLDRKFVPALSAFAVAGAGAPTLTKAEIKGNKLLLTASGAFVAGTHTIAYTQPASTQIRLQDEGGNLVASWTAAAIAAS